MADPPPPDLGRFSQRLLDSFIAAVTERHPSGSLTPADLKDALAAMLGSPAYAHFIEHFQADLVADATRHMLWRQRKDPLRRLIVHPFASAFTDGTLHRSMLTNYFAFIHLVIGDEVEGLREACQDVLAELHQRPDFTWDMFYADPRAKLVLWQVLARIANTFGRFDARREWFITIMQTEHQAVSLSSNAFIPVAHSPDHQITFRDREFLIMFEALFDTVRGLPEPERARFTDHFKLPPEAIFDRLLANLDRAVGHRQAARS